MKIHHATVQLGLTLPLLALLFCIGVSGHAAQASRPTPLFNGKDLSGWQKPSGEWLAAKSVSLNPQDNKKFAVEPGTGILVNGLKAPTVDILTEAQYGDVELHIEFVVPKNSNSGVYFMGRYEVQVFDSWGVEKPKYADCGGIYERWKDGKGYEGTAPRVNACKAPGEWQTYDVVFRAPRFDASGKKTENARFIKVVHNGQVIHENVEATGPTRSARFENDEKPKGPLMLQGDHGPVAYRNIRIKSVVLK